MGERKKETQQRKGVGDGETRKERSDLGISKPGDLDPLCLLIGRFRKRQNKRKAQGVFRNGLGAFQQGWRAI